MNSNFLYPNVTSVPSKSDLGQTDKSGPKPEKGEFDQVFDQAVQSTGKPGTPAGAVDLNQVKSPLKFSAHASQRLKERNIALDPATLSKVNDAIDKCDAKGVEDTLVLAGDAALIVSVKNRTVVTAMDKTQLKGNVFTNIDGAVIV